MHESIEKCFHEMKWCKNRITSAILSGSHRDVFVLQRFLCYRYVLLYIITITGLSLSSIWLINEVVQRTVSPCGK